MIQFILRNNYFEFSEKVFQQTSGKAVVGPSNFCKRKNSNF